MFRPEMVITRRLFINSLMGFFAGKLRKKLPERNEKGEFLKEKEYFILTKDYIVELLGELNKIFRLED